VREKGARRVTDTAVLEHDYANFRRAANQAPPADWADRVPALSRAELVWTAAAGAPQFFADTSTWQPYYDDSYPYLINSFRGDSGSSTDAKAVGNWAWSKHAIARGALRICIIYAVYIPGNNTEILSRLKAFLGQTCPTRVCFRVDVESGQGFAGPGNHSSGANQLASMFANYAGSWDRVEAYANASDYRGGWPQCDPRLKKCLAAYNADPLPAGYYSKQYYGALPYPSPTGYPRTVQPFGSFVDMNAVTRNINQIEQDYGVIDMPTPEEYAAAVWAKGVKNDATGVVQSAGDRLIGAQSQNDLDAAVKAVAAQARANGAGISTLQTTVSSLHLTLSPADVTAIAAAVIAGMPGGGAPPTLDEITQSFTNVVNQTRLTIPTE
jgi:hypothetical protein